MSLPRPKAAFLVTVCSLACAGFSLLWTIRAFRWNPVDPLPEHNARFAELRAALPQGQVFGYIDEPHGSAEKEAAKFRYYATAYGFAPVFIERSVEHRYLIGNFVTSPSPGYFEKLGLRVQRDFGRGVFLLENPKFH